MLPVCIVQLRSIPKLAAMLALALCSLSNSHAQSATSPTSSETPESIDEVWQKASSKYDAQRVALLKDIENVDREGPYRADWESLRNYETPEWYKDAKFGIFIHWGVYSVPAFGSEWYPRMMYVEGSPEYRHHVETYGKQDKFGYKDFIPMLNAEHFDPTAWAELFKKAGAKYVVPVAEHHDGFAMYESGLSDWTVAKMGPRRDTTGELAKAVRAAGLHFGVSSHRVEHNFFLGPGRTIPSDVNDPQYAMLYGPAHNWVMNPQGTPLNNDFTYVSSAWANDWLARSAELVEKYHPDIVYFDWWIGQAPIRAYLTQFAAFYYNSSLKYGDHVGVINYKDYAMQEHSGVLDLERGQSVDIRPLYWQTDTSVSNKSWGYIENDTFKSPEFVLDQLIDIVTKNGNLLLNIGPRSDGTIPEPVQKVLLMWGLGSTSTVKRSTPRGRGGCTAKGRPKLPADRFTTQIPPTTLPKDFRFTTKGDTLYVIGLAWPANGEAAVRSLAATVGSEPVASVALLGGDASLRFEQKADGLHVHLPNTPPAKYAYALRVKFQHAAP